MKEIHVVAAIIIDEAGKIFATQRGYGPFKGGWEFPGGKIEYGEGKEEALRREIMEELETEIQVGKLLCSIRYSYPEFILNMDCFLCSLITDKLNLIEHSDSKWLSIDEIDSLNWLEADIEAVEAIKKYFQ